MLSGSKEYHTTWGARQHVDSIEHGGTATVSSLSFSHFSRCRALSAERLHDRLRKSQPGGIPRTYKGVPPTATRYSNARRSMRVPAGAARPAPGRTLFRFRAQHCI